MCGIARPSPSLHPRIPAHRLQAALGGGVKSAFTTHPITATLVSMETEPPSVGKQDCVHNTGRGPNGCRLTPGRGHSRWHDARMLEELVIVEGNFYGKKKCCHLSTTFRIIRPIRALPSICANNNNNKKNTPPFYYRFTARFIASCAPLIPGRSFISLPRPATM